MLVYQFYGYCAVSSHIKIAQTETLQSTLKGISKGRYGHQFVATIHMQVANQQYNKAREFILRSRVTLSQDKQYSWDMQCSARLNV